MDVNVPDRPDDNNEETPISFQPRIYPSSSVLRDKSGNTSMELFSHSLLRRDKLIMLNQAHPLVERQAAQLLSELSLCVHQLALTCSKYKHDGAEVEKNLVEYQENVKAEMLGIQDDMKRFSVAQAEHEETRKQLEAEKLNTTQLQGEVNDLKKKLAEVTSQFDQQRMTLAEQRRTLIEEVMRGAVERYLTSPQYKTSLEKIELEARKKAVRDFLKSEELDSLILKNAMNDRDDGFFKAVDYMKQLDFKPPMSFDEFEANYRTKELIRPSVAIDSPDGISFPEFKAIIETVEEENRQWRESQGTATFMEELEATYERGSFRNEGEVDGALATGANGEAPIKLEEIDEAGSNLNAEMLVERIDAATDNAAQPDADMDEA